MGTDIISVILRLHEDLWANISLPFRGVSGIVSLPLGQIEPQSPHFGFFRLPWQHFPILMSFRSSPTKELPLWKF